MPKNTKDISELKGGEIKTPIDSAYHSPSSKQVEEKFPTKNIKPKPIHILHLSLEQAYMLATFSRSKWPERALASLFGFLGALPGAVDAYTKASNPDVVVKLISFEGTEVLTAVVFLTLFVASLVGRITAEKTSLEYLEELKTGTPYLNCWRRLQLHLFGKS